MRFPWQAPAASSGQGKGKALCASACPSLRLLSSAPSPTAPRLFLICLLTPYPEPTPLPPLFSENDFVSFTTEGMEATRFQVL